jgi:hypothetical protein
VKKPAIAILCLVLCTALAGGEKKGFSPPPAAHARTYPAQETHSDEKVSIAIDPFDMPDKASIFRVNYQAHDLLPIRVIVSNDGDDTLMLTDLKVVYITVKREKIEPATSEDIYRRLAKLNRRPDQPRVSPMPLPKRKIQSISKDDLAEISDAMFAPVPVTAHSTNSGFLFFDISGVETALAGAHVYISGLKINSKELFYFDIPVEKYLKSQPVK